MRKIDTSNVTKHLTLADRHVAEAERLIEQQHVLIVDLQRKGLSTTLAKQVLKSFETTLALSKRHRLTLRAAALPLAPTFPFVVELPVARPADAEALVGKVRQWLRNNDGGENSCSIVHDGGRTAVHFGFANRNVADRCKATWSKD